MPEPKLQLEGCFRWNERPEQTRTSLFRLHESKTEQVTDPTLQESRPELSRHHRRIGEAEDQRRGHRGLAAAMLLADSAEHAALQRGQQTDIRPGKHAGQGSEPEPHRAADGRDTDAGLLLRPEAA